MRGEYCAWYPWVDESLVAEGVPLKNALDLIGGRIEVVSLNAVTFSFEAQRKPEEASDKRNGLAVLALKQVGDPIG